MIDLFASLLRLWGRVQASRYKQRRKDFLNEPTGWSRKLLGAFYFHLHYRMAGGGAPIFLKTAATMTLHNILFLVVLSKAFPFAKTSTPKSRHSFTSTPGRCHAVLHCRFYVQYALCVSNSLRLLFSLSWKDFSCFFLVLSISVLFVSVFLKTSLFSRFVRGIPIILP